MLKDTILEIHIYKLAYYDDFIDYIMHARSIFSRERAL